MRVRAGPGYILRPARGVPASCDWSFQTTDLLLVPTTFPHLCPDCSPLLSMPSPLLLTCSDDCCFSIQLKSCLPQQLLQTLSLPAADKYSLVPYGLESWHSAT